MGFIESWEQAVTWLVLFVVLYALVSGKIRYDLAAFGGLLLLGILGLRAPSKLFSGFASPALFTIVTVLVMSAGIIESGLFSGFGKKIAARAKKHRTQIFTIFVSTSFLSAFMNNIGAIGIVLPTAKRMAQRAKIPQSTFGIPIAYAAILGGSVTLIGTASNLIVSTYRFNALGESFNMFDFSLHGLAMLFSGIIVLFICHACGLRPIKNVRFSSSSRNMEDKEVVTDYAIPRNRKKSLIVLLTLVPIIILTGIGLVHPSVAFGIIVIIWLFSGVLAYKTALDNVNIPIIIFLGSMFGISAVLEETGALNAVVSFISPVFMSLSPFLLIMVFLFLTAVFANILSNSVAAILMAPVAVAFWGTGVVSLSLDALLMAVAAGASLGLVIPSHQATIVVMNSMDFPRKSFITTGAAITVIAGPFAAFIIHAIWL